MPVARQRARAPAALRPWVVIRERRAGIVATPTVSAGGAGGGRRGRRGRPAALAPRGPDEAGGTDRVHATRVPGGGDVSPRSGRVAGRRWPRRARAGRGRPRRAAPA